MPSWLPSVETVAYLSFVVSVIAGSIAVAAGAITSVASNRVNQLESARRDRERDEAALAIARADAAAAEANARAEEAKAEAARANERLQRAQEMRRLTRPQAEALKPLLESEWFQSAPKPKLRVSSVEDAEARMYAMQWQNFLKSCGVDIYPTDGGFPSTCAQLAPSATGLTLTVKSLNATLEAQPFTRFHRALIELGIEHQLEVNTALRDREAVLHVLRKPST